jgi:hypothetical protein
MKKTKEQLKTELKCICARLERLITDVTHYYGKEPMAFAYLNGAIGYLKAMLNNMK